MHPSCVHHGCSAAFQQSINTGADWQDCQTEIGDCGILQDVSLLQMHGTGTPLGDPIEVGAASAVLRPAQTDRMAQPVRLAADKSWHGHTEPAAGLLGLCHAAAALRAAAFTPICHLSQVTCCPQAPPKCNSRASCCLMSMVEGSSRDQPSRCLHALATHPSCPHNATCRAT